MKQELFQTKPNAFLRLSGKILMFFTVGQVMCCYTLNKIRTKVLLQFGGDVIVIFEFATCLGSSIDPGRSLKVVSQSSDYNAMGEFRCRNNGVLFYSNKTEVVSNKTKCFDQWKDSNIIQCWTGVVFLQNLFRVAAILGVMQNCCKNCLFSPQIKIYAGVSKHHEYFSCLFFFVYSLMLC